MQMEGKNGGGGGGGGGAGNEAKAYASLNVCGAI